MTTADRADVRALIAQLLEAITEPRQPETPAPQSMPERVLFTVEEAAAQLGIGKTLTWRLVGTGELDSVRIGRLRRVPKAAIAAYAARLIADQTGPTAA
ncbi:DNA binding domain-containing protein, excisionase family [Actinokineospora alba]|uniref:DNA binding domain-containing protein, excisionase family n=1 Tax=Actinokineospora alba TaxID=504798 RepID=A0A1H0T8B5_9PSEU|nr:excisionase family DNA-binding protein [Actinokineospora alba]TDP66314.1 excisionase family DNA binding protein [Actinokineospora alba]SDJ21795.1 DNA binding domain-containing protein, excisionase family [Actinokineospora alba]SDP50282.1 DNA binding domain-containing protein, excisionase family [Actinokineospora alba]